MISSFKKKNIFSPKEEKKNTIKRKQTNFNAYHGPNYINNEPMTPHELKKSITKFQPSNAIYDEIKIKPQIRRQSTRRKKVKFIVTKTFFHQDKSERASIKEKFRSNKTLRIPSPEREFKNDKKEKIKLTNDIILSKKEETVNLKIVETQILNKIENLKFIYQKESLVSDDIFENNILNSNNNIKNKNIRGTFITNVKKKKNNKSFKSRFKKKNDFKENENIKNSVLSNNHKNDDDSTFRSISIDNNQSKSALLKKIYSSKIETGINNSEFLNLTDYRNYNKDDYTKNTFIDRNERLRNIKRIKPLYDSFDDDESEKDNDDFNGNVIPQTSNILFFLDLTIFLSCIYSLFYIPLRMSNSECFCYKENKFHKLLFYFIDLLYICDLCLSFFRGYYNFQLKLVRNNKKIFFHYLKKDFTFDFLEAIPIYSYSKYLCAINKEVNYCYRYNMSSSLFFLRILTSLKLIKIFKVKDKQKNVSFNYLFDLFSENYSLEKNIDNTFDFLFCFLAFHFLACLNIFISKQTYPNWIINMELHDEPLIYIYIASCYSLIETLTTVGYGDVVCQCETERVFQIIVLAVGVIAYSYLISAFGNLFKNESQSSIKYDNYKKILEEIRVEYPKMPFKLYKKIFNNIETRNKSEKKLDGNILTNSLPFNLKNALLLVMYKSIIKNFKFFKNCDNSNFVIQILSSFVPTTSKKNEFLLYEGEMIEDLIFVKDGRLSLEAAIDMDDPENSIDKYFNINFNGITSAKELKKLEEKNNNNNTVIIQPRKSKNFDIVRFELNNAVKKQVGFLLNEDCDEPSILDKTKYNNKKDKTYLRTLGSELLKHEPIKNEKGNYKYLKILDIRKNENFGGLYIFLRRPSPLSLKVRSKFADLYLLPKKEIFSISKNYNNIWKKIYKKDFHNMISIKHQTFNLLNKFIEMNGIVKINPADVTKNYLFDDKLNISENVILNNTRISLFSPNNKQKRISFNLDTTGKKIFNSNSSLKASLIHDYNKKFDKINPKEMVFTSQIIKNKKILESLNKLNNNIINDNKNDISIKENNNNNKIKTVIEEKKDNNDKIDNNINNTNIIKEDLKRSDNKDKIESNINNESIIKENLKKNDNEEKNSSYTASGIPLQNDIKNNNENCNNTIKLTNQKEEFQPKTLNQIFDDRKTLEIKEEIRKSKRKETKKKIYSFGKKTIELFKNRDFKIIFGGNNDNNYYEIKNTNCLPSKTIVEDNDDYEKINNYISLCQDNSFLNKVSQMSSDDGNILDQFNKKDLIPEGVISFSYQSLYKNINLHTNMKYSKKTIFQEKTLSFLDKLIKEEDENNSSSIKTFNSSSLSNSFENIKKMITGGSKIVKNDNMSLSKSSIFDKYEDLLNEKDSNKLNLSFEKIPVKSKLTENKLLVKKKTRLKKKSKNFFSMLMKSDVKEKNNQSKINKKITKGNTNYLNNNERIKLQKTIKFDSTLSGENNKNLFKKKRMKTIKKSSEKLKRKKTKKYNRHSDISNNIQRVKTLKGLYDIINENNSPNDKSNIKEKSNVRRSKIKKINTDKYIFSKNNNLSSKFINDKRLPTFGTKQKDIEEKKDSLDYFAKEQKDEDCIII